MRLVAVLLALVAFQVWWFGRETPTEKRLADAASAIAGHEVAVRCPSIWRRLVEVSSFGGTAHYDAEGKPSHAKLAHEVCQAFEDLPERGFPADVDCLDGAVHACDDWVLDVAFAVHVLAHEAWHLNGVRDEATAECYAFQSVAELSVRFGARQAVGQRIAAYLASQGTAATFPQYRTTSDCRAGGRLDLHPATPAWPSF